MIGTNLNNDTDSMKFTVFGPENRAQFDPRTIECFEQLLEKFGEVEFRSITKTEKCVRIVAEIGYLPTPLAALGASFQQAAERLVCVTKGINEEPPAL